MIQRVGVLIALLAAAPAWPQVPSGGEFRVNTYTTSRQWHGFAAMAPAGDFVIAWSSLDQDGSGGGVFGQRYDAEGVPRGSEFQINTHTTHHQAAFGESPVAVDRAGNFVVAWQSYEQDGDLQGVFRRRYDSSGAALEPERQVNTYTTARQGRFAIGPEIERAPDGRFVVVWDSDTQDGSGFGIFGQRYDRLGMPAGPEFQVNVYTTDYQIHPDVGMDAAGNFTVVWSSYLQDGSGYGVFGRNFDASGAALGGEFQVNVYTTGSQPSLFLNGPQVARAANGTFVVVWDDAGYQDGSGDGVFARLYDAGGSPIGGELQVNTYTSTNQYLSALAMDDLGNFVVAWSSYPAAPGDPDGGIVAQRFHASGNRRGAEFRVNVATSGTQAFPRIASDHVGNVLVTWYDDTQEGSDLGLYARRFGGLLPAALRVDTTGNAVLEPGESVDVRPSWRNVNGAAQTFGAALSNFTGPAGATYSITDGTGDYGTVADGATAPCTGCYGVAVSSPPTRPAAHWDASTVESITPDAQGQQKQWLLHVGASFADVPHGSGFYQFIETLLHHGITGGCSGTSYCPTLSTTREQMSVFVLVAKEGAGYRPPACTTPVFNDVPASSPFCRFIEELSRRGVVSGCGGGGYCPAQPVTREQMAVFVLRTAEPTLEPPACTTPMFADVPANSPFCRWIEELARRGVVTGCGDGNYCPAAAVTREQMGVFITVTFGLTLYGP